MNKKLILICITIFINNTQSLLSSYSSLASYITPEMQSQINTLQPKYLQQFTEDLNDANQRIQEFEEENPVRVGDWNAWVYVMCGPCIATWDNYDNKTRRERQTNTERRLVQDYIDLHIKEQAKEQIVAYESALLTSRLYKATLISWDQATMQLANEQNPHIPRANVLLYGIAAVANQESNSVVCINSQNMD
ncbi:MAG: hypothetical protein Q8Q60_03505 [Candidatus Chromulinivorax sp.]|nr:hypothetical protein [Candidatus Chromulinivorax sp.]